jgi:hypothetical protein
VPRHIEEPPPRRPAYFWWLLANALALCFAVVSWAVCLHVFGSPEIPRNYAILEKLGRAEALRRFTVLDVPNGNSMSPPELYRKFFVEDQLERINSLLMRNYITNFARPLLLTYVEGDYQVEEVRRLTESDFFNPGFVLRARAQVKPDDFTVAAPYPVMIEYLFPCSDPLTADLFQVGDMLSVRKSPNCAAVVHVSHLEEDDERLLYLTVIPIAYGPYRVGDDSEFEIEPPTRLRPAAGFPVIKR